MNEVSTMGNLINTLGYATVALSVIFVVFLSLISYVIYQNKKLTENLINSNKQNIEELKKSMDKLTDNIQKMNKGYETILSDIVSEISKLNDKYVEVTGTLANVIYEEKSLSPDAFHQVVKRISTNFIYKSLIDVYDLLDGNGFVNDKMINLLQDNIKRALERRRAEGLEVVRSLNFNKCNIDELMMQGELIYNKYITKLEQDVINQIVIEDLQEDKNYKRLKTLIKNTLFSYLDEISALTKEISKK